MEFYMELDELKTDFCIALETALSDEPTKETRQEAYERLTDVFDHLVSLIYDIATQR